MDKNMTLAFQDLQKKHAIIEFSEGILKKIVEVFCDSPYIMLQNYKDTLLEIQESFYFFKNEAMDQIADDELIENEFCVCFDKDNIIYILNSYSLIIKDY